MKMGPFRPRSFFSLLLSGFLFVSLPLFTALFSSVQIIDNLVQQSAVAIFRSVSSVDKSRQLVDLIQDQERSARLYHVLNDYDQLVNVKITQEKIEQALEQFANNNSDVNLLLGIDQFKAKSRQLVAMLDSQSGGPEERNASKDAALFMYAEISSIALDLEKLTNNMMEKEVEALKDNVRRNKKTLIWQVSGLIAFSVLLIIIFISLIIKPVSQLDKGIYRLGEGDFSTPIVVSGSKDLEALGDKLDWLRKRLDTLDKEKVKMIAHISHELKTPLASIKEGAGLLKDGVVGSLSSGQEEVVSILDNNCDKLQRLIENILDFNMAEAKEIPVDQKEVRLDALIEEVVADHHNQILARNINLTLDLESAETKGNPNQIKTVFDNLLANAVKFTPDEGTIHIFMRLKKNTVNVIIKDSGPGISEEDRPQIFLPFFQGQHKKQSGVKGSGLGLAISKEYVQNCGGTLRLLPSRHGARFSVTLPRIKV